MSWLRVYERDGKQYAEIDVTGIHRFHAETDMFGYSLTFGVDVYADESVGCPVIPVDMKEYNKIRRLVDGNIPETDEG